MAGEIEAIYLGPMLERERILTVHEAAQVRGVSVDTIRRLLKRGELPKVKLSDRRIGVRARDALAMTTT